MRLQVTMLADSGISFANGYRKANDLGNRAHLLLLKPRAPWNVAAEAACARPPHQTPRHAAGRVRLRSLLRH
jgi:hypothetical protein